MPATAVRWPYKVFKRYNLHLTSPTIRQQRHDQSMSVIAIHLCSIVGCRYAIWRTHPVIELHNVEALYDVHKQPDTYAKGSLECAFVFHVEVFALEHYLIEWACIIHVSPLRFHPNGL